MELKQNERLFIDLLKKDLENLGNIQEATKQYAVIENMCKQLLLLNNKELTGKIEKYFEVQQKVKDQVQKLNEDLQELTDKYSKNCTRMYEEIKKL